MGDVVYVLHEDVKWEGSSLTGVFSTADKAKRCAESEASAYDGAPVWVDADGGAVWDLPHGRCWVVSPMTIDQPDLWPETLSPSRIIDKLSH